MIDSTRVKKYLEMCAKSRDFFVVLTRVPNNLLMLKHMRKRRDNPYRLSINIMEISPPRLLPKQKAIVWATNPNGDSRGSSSKY